MKTWELKQKQSLPLSDKIKMTERRIREYYEMYDGDIYLADSGGKDSSVLRDIIRSMYPDVVSVFNDTGLEYPEIREFMRSIDNVIWLKPKKSFRTILKEYGFPVISKENSQKIHEIRTTKSAKLLDKRLNGNGTPYKSGKLPEKWKFLIDSDIKISDKCCHYLKKDIAKRYERETGNKVITGEMAYESHARMQKYLRSGCNSFDTNRPRSMPISFWTEADIWQYIKGKNLPISKIYSMGYKRTGCAFCMFGVHLEKGENRFQKMAKTHPKLYNYCINHIGLGNVLNILKVDYKPYQEQLKLNL